MPAEILYAIQIREKQGQDFQDLKQDVQDAFNHPVHPENILLVLSIKVLRRTRRR